MEHYKAAIPRSSWNVQCHDAAGKLKWEENFQNMIFDAAINDLLNLYFKGLGSAPTNWFIGLVNAGAVFAGSDIMASHIGWTENVNYVAANRPPLVLGTVAAKSVDNVASRAVFTITGAGGNIAGTFLTTSNVKGGTVGVLYAGAAFTTGTKAVVATDTLTVAVVLSGA